MEIRVHVQPRAARSAVVGLHGDRLKVRLAAPPVDGEANAELVRLLSETLGLRRSDVAIVAGATGRHKTVTVPGDTPLPADWWGAVTVHARGQNRG